MNNNNYPMYMLCPSAPGILEYWDKVLQCILIELDADGLFLDQIAGGFRPQYCYDPAHEHDHPDTYGTGMIQMIQHIVNRARMLKPDALISGELCHDVRSIYLDETHGRGYVTIDNVVPETEKGKLETEPTEYYAFLKYFSPLARSQTVPLDLVMDGSPGHMDQLFYTENREIFDYGFTPCPTQYPGVIAYLYGNPLSSSAILAVRSHASLDAVEVYLPRDFTSFDKAEKPSIIINKNTVSVKAGPTPLYYKLNAN